MTKRPRSEDCERLTLARVRPLVQPGAEALRLADGTVLALRWGAVRGCYGGDRDGRGPAAHLPELWGQCPCAPSPSCQGLGLLELHPRFAALPSPAWRPRRLPEAPQLDA
jgi:hypothetical protein